MDGIKPNLTGVQSGQSLASASGASPGRQLRQPSVHQQSSAPLIPGSGDAAALAASQVNTRRVATDIDPSTGRVVSLFIDKESGEIVDQVPSEAMLRLLAKTRELLGGLLDETV